MSLGDPVWPQGQSLASDTYLPRLLEGLESLRSQNVLCDVTLEAEQVSFPAHKAVLAAASSYCKMRFLEGDGAGPDAPVKLVGVTARGLRNVLSFLYSNRLELTLPTLEETFRAAEGLLVREVMTLCFRFLEDGLNPRSCLEILHVSRRLGPKELVEKALRCVRRHGSEILADSARLRELDEATLCQILDGAEVGNLTERELFHAGVCWLHHDSTRLKDAAAVLQHIRFPLIPLRDLQKFVQNVSLMKTDPACRRYLLEALDYHSQPYAQPVLQSERTQVRAGADSLLVLGGRSADNALRDDVWAADPSGRSWKRIGKLHGPVYNHCVAVLRDFVFVLGGQERFDPTGQCPSNKVFRFDPRQNAWLQVASMQGRRTRFHAGALNDRLVAVGGGALLGTLTDTAEEYQPVDNEWRTLPPFPAPVADHAGASHKGILYVAGGFSASKTTCETYSYLSRLRRWIKNRPMTFARCDHGMATVGDRIFCVGGRALTNAGEWVPVNQTEFYCPATDQWALLHLSAFDLCQFGLAVHRLQMYITGGGALQRRTKEDGVFICDPGEKVWEKAGSLPVALADHASCFTRLPCWITGEQQEEREEASVTIKKTSTLNLFITSTHVPSGGREASSTSQGI
ncbi:kelch-like protein 9 [Pogona vitticeps]